VIGCALPMKWCSLAYMWLTAVSSSAHTQGSHITAYILVR